jgi:hypothetical protein
MQGSRFSTMRVVLWCLAGGAAGLAQAQSPSDTARHSQTPLACHFDSGPRAGQTQELPATQEASPPRVGSSCSDGSSSFGILIAPSADVSDARTEGSAASSRELTSICQFSAGPRAGEIVDLARISDAAPIAVGSPCADGASSGIAVADPNGSGSTPWSSPIPSGSPAVPSTICQFMSGPKAHGWHDYAPLSPAALGSSCRDGIGSAGVVVALGHGQHY